MNHIFLHIQLFDDGGMKEFLGAIFGCTGACVILGYVWFYGKIERWKESEWIDLVSIVWHHHKKGEDKMF
ncbi:hypothetical protein MtrunA17_Chr5g0396681 [Medicago truncatula]|uniref:Transmembrane protein, putative n=1 Tax=Medicago truncatula TaxID=3880 RepID=G7KAK7_MEDTR|nr:transmembrane protein, putative [Medicago truncatula]RHN53516.1 hypothetical protein MtrunA17_Chr5g0396681 [Medicago truncatula]